MRISKSALILFFFANIFVTALVSSKVAEATATNATRIPWGTFYVSRSSNPLPQTPSPSPGVWASNGILQECNGGANSSGTCYPAASPEATPNPFPSADAGATLGAAAATKLDTCSTGNIGTICYRPTDVVRALKDHGILAQ